MDQTLKTASFSGVCTANSDLTLVSDRISSPFTIAHIAAHFALNTNRLLQLSFFVSPDPDAPTSGPPGGFDVLGEYGQVSYITGDDDVKRFDNSARSQTSPSWLKVYAHNTDAFDHSVDVQITIQIHPRK